MIARIDSAPDVLPARALRECLVAGVPVEKSLIIRSATVEFLLARVGSPLNYRRHLVAELFQHTHMWVRFARHATGRTLSYKRLTTEQVALVLIYLHQATAAESDSVPADWLHVPRPTRRSRKTQRVVAIWVDRQRARTRCIPDDLTPGFFTWPLEIDALILQYRRDATEADRRRVHKLLRAWAPVTSTASTPPLTTTAIAPTAAAVTVWKEV